MKIVKATCPGCGASLEEAQDSRLTKCPHCGTNVVLDQSGETGPGGHLELSLVYLQAGNLREADSCLSRALQKSPGNREAWLWKAVVAAMEARFEEADVYWQRSGLDEDQVTRHLAQLIRSKPRVAYWLTDAVSEVDKEALHWGTMFLEAATRVDLGPRADLQERLVIECRDLSWTAAREGDYSRAVSILEQAPYFPDRPQSPSHCNKSAIAYQYRELAYWIGVESKPPEDALTRKCFERAMELRPSLKESVAELYLDIAERFDKTESTRAEYLKRALELDPSLDAGLRS